MRDRGIGHQPLDVALADPGADVLAVSTVFGNVPLAQATDNILAVLAVAGAAHGHTTVLIVGLVLSIALMGLASTWIARVINRYPWIAWAGLLVILYVALKMIYEGSHQLGWI